MANQDVLVKEVDIIKTYNHKLGNFLVSLCENLYQFRHEVRGELDKLQESKKCIRRERERINDEIRYAQQKYHDAYDYGSYKTYYRPDGTTQTVFIPDYGYVDQCRRERDHLTGPVYHQARTCEDLAHNRIMQATQIINLIDQRTDAFQSSIQIYIEYGRKYLDKVVQNIDQYKETNSQA